MQGEEQMSGKCSPKKNETIKFSRQVRYATQDGSGVAGWL